MKEKRKQMADAVEELDFETAALIRDEILTLEGNEIPSAKIKPRNRKGK
jgi:protein-arginine kinase activator protein McsA